MKRFRVSHIFRKTLALHLRELPRLTLYASVHTITETAFSTDEALLNLSAVRGDLLVSLRCVLLSGLPANVRFGRRVQRVAATPSNLKRWEVAHGMDISGPIYGAAEG